MSEDKRNSKNTEKEVFNTSENKNVKEKYSIQSQKDRNRFLESTMNPIIQSQKDRNRFLESAMSSSMTNVRNNWLLSASVVKNISQTNNEEEVKGIFDKIPRGKFKISQEYDEKHDVLEYVLTNTGDQSSVPLKDVASTIAVSEFLTSMTVSEIFDFYNFLVKFPMFGNMHPIGKKIFEEIPKIQLKEFKDLTLFRVRDRDIAEKDIPFTDLEMFEAPFGLANHGRFNVIGQGELYTCSNRDVALKEIAQNKENLRYDIIKWRLQKPVHLLEISNFDNALGKYISIEKRGNSNAYLVSNFLSQCMKYHGINGLSYVSIADKNETNFVFFDFENNWFERIGREVDVKFQLN